MRIKVVPLQTERHRKLPSFLYTVVNWREQILKCVSTSYESSLFIYQISILIDQLSILIMKISLH